MTEKADCGAVVTRGCGSGDAVYEEKQRDISYL